MKSLEFRNVFFAQDERGRGKLIEQDEKDEKGINVKVSREDLKKSIKENPTVEISAPDNEEKEQDR